MYIRIVCAPISVLGGLSVCMVDGVCVCMHTGTFLKKDILCLNLVFPLFLQFEVSRQHEAWGACVLGCLGNDGDATHGESEKSSVRQENLKCLKQRQEKDMILKKV